MIEEVFSAEIGFGEKIYLKKIHFPGKSGSKRISLISGIHGDELEGLYILNLLIEFLKKNKESILNTIDIYPVVNTLALNSLNRYSPFYKKDLNRLFRIEEREDLIDLLAVKLVEDTYGSDIAVDIHSSNIFLKEVPQARIPSEYAKRLVPISFKMNLDFIWVYDNHLSSESTFSHFMNKNGTKTVLIETGVGLRINKKNSKQIFSGLLNLLISEDFLSIEKDIQVKNPLFSVDGKIHFIHSPVSGLFIPFLSHGSYVKRNQEIGKIVSPLGDISEIIYSPVDGFLFTLRAVPVVHEGNIIARIFEEKVG